MLCFGQPSPLRCVLLSLQGLTILQGPQVKIGADCVIVLDIRQYAGVLFLVIIRFSRRRKWRPRKHEAADRLAPINATRNIGRYLYPQKPYVLLSIESIKINNYRAATDRLSVTALFYEYAIGIGLFDRMFFTGRKIPGR